MPSFTKISLKLCSWDRQTKAGKYMDPGFYTDPKTQSEILMLLVTGIIT